MYIYIYIYIYISLSIYMSIYIYICIFRSHFGSSLALPLLAGCPGGVLPPRPRNGLFEVIGGYCGRG